MALVYQKVNNLDFPHLHTELGHSVDIAPNIVSPMITTMDAVHHLGIILASNQSAQQTGSYTPT
jgi:hypothetical protein